MKTAKSLYIPIGLLIIVLLNIGASVFFFRIDLTADKRYSIAAPTRELMRNLEKPLTITIYLDGDLNAGFLRLKKATAELLDEFDVYADKNISYVFVNPSEADNADERNKNYEKMLAKGMTPTAIYEKNAEGKSMQTIIFPWAEIECNGKTQSLCLLKNVRGNSGEENLNISIETLEFEFTDAIRMLLRTKVQKIAFLEGHGELPEENTYDISKALSRYFQIDRGALGNDASVLNDYSAIVIAAPQTAFSETEKYIIDQYIMYGGRVLWLVDGVRFNNQDLSHTGMSPAIPLNLNLTDMLFRYGIRINSILLQDEQCMLVPVNVAPQGSTANFQPLPWYFAPLLLTSPAHPVSRNIAPLSSIFVSGIDFVGENSNLKKDVLLVTSSATHIIATPTTINMEEIDVPEGYFNMAYVPTAGAMEGSFESVFAHRIKPQEIVNARPQLSKSVPTKQIVIANGSLISNDIENGKALPVGYDRYTQNQFGNRDFLINALLYLTDDDGWINLRNKELTMRMLNKNISRTQRTLIQWLNVGIPIFLLLLLAIVFHFYRRHKYARKIS